MAHHPNPARIAMAAGPGAARRLGRPGPAAPHATGAVDRDRGLPLSIAGTRTVAGGAA